MTGITVLDVIEETKYSSGWTIYSTLCLIGLIVFLIALALLIKYKFDEIFTHTIYKYIFNFVGISLITSTFLLILSINLGHPYIQTKYQVLLGDEVKITEFYNKYNILEQKGITYIIEEKGNQYE